MRNSPRHDTQLWGIVVGVTPVTSGKTAQIIYDATGFRISEPSKWGREMVATGLLTDQGTGTWLQFDSAEIDRFITAHPYLGTLPFPYLGVSVGSMVEHEVYPIATPQTPFRTYAGYDRHNRAGLSPRERVGGLAASWRTGEDTAQEVVDRKLPLIADVKGVIEPEMIRWPTKVVALTDGGYGFEVDPDRFGHPLIETGALIDIPRGSLFRRPIDTPRTSRRRPSPVPSAAPLDRDQVAGLGEQMAHVLLPAMIGDNPAPLARAAWAAHQIIAAIGELLDPAGDNQTARLADLAEYAQAIREAAGHHAGGTSSRTAG